MLDESFIINCEKELKKEFSKIDEQCKKNSKKIIDAFHKYKISESDLNGTLGYGYNDSGRDKIDNIFANIMGAEAGLVRNQIISGSHAINVSLFALLRPNDTLLSITGLPYDTLHSVIGLKENNSSLISYGIKYKMIDLIDNDFDYKSIEKELKNDINVIHIQRSRGYSLRDSLTIDKLEKVIKFIKKINKNIIIFVDNCYCELVEDKSPIEVGADICAGSLIKNLGAGIATNGGYIVGRKDLVELCGERLTLPGEGIEVGPSENANRKFLLGLFLSPTVVSSSLKTAILTSYALEKLGYKVSPKYNEFRTDIIQTVELKTKENLVAFTQGLQSSSPIDSFVRVLPAPMPGYPFDEVMASGSFTQGSTIELSADAPVIPPYTLYMQGGLTFEYGKLGIMHALSKIKEAK